MRFFAVMVLIFSIFSGCSVNNDRLDQATDLRKKLLEADQCTFQAVITADYGEETHTFQMNCTIDTSGNLNFIVTEPASISGISGYVSEEDAALTFDDKVLAFPMLADGQISPVCSPWLFMKALRGGYLSGCSKEDTGLCLYIDDSFHESPICFEIYTDTDTNPVHVDLIWQNCRILSLDIKNFVIV